jgi:hypothetical protein
MHLLQTRIRPLQFLGCSKKWVLAELGHSQFQNRPLPGTGGWALAFPPRAYEEAKMPVLIMWAVPAVIVIGGVGYYLVRAVH